MGIFSDTCQALVDPATGRALRGEALEEAKKNPKAPRCGNSVKKAARFCGKCGNGAPGGWWQCPGCGKWVGNESNFCWNCNKPMHPEQRTGMSGGVWQKSAEVFAEKFDAGDIKLLLKGSGLVVEAGTAAILTDGGRFKDVLMPGRYNLDGLARKINNWGDPPPRTVVLVENGDVVVPLRIDNLRSADGFPVEFYTEVAFHFTEKRAEAFLENLFKSRERLSAKEIADILGREIVYAVQNVCHTTNMEDLVKDPQRRTRLEDELSSILGKTLERYGLEIVRVPSAEFTGKEYEQLAAKSGELEIKRRELEFGQRMRELVSSEKMHGFKSENELEEYVRQMAQEKNIAAAQRDVELKRLLQVNRRELEASEVSWQMAQEMEKISHQIGLKLKWDEYTNGKLRTDTTLQIELKELDDTYRRTRKLEDAQVDAKAREIAFGAEAKEVEAAIDWRAKKQAVERTNLAETAKILEGKSIETLIGLIDDPAKREQLLALNKQTGMKGLSKEQILAQNAVDSPELARLLAEMERNKNTDRDREWDERKKMQEDMANRLERVMKMALETTAVAAKQGSATTILK